MFVFSPLGISFKKLKRQKQIPKVHASGRPGASLESIHDSMDLVQLTSAEFTILDVWKKRKKNGSNKEKLGWFLQNQAQKLKTT